jgi:hypothetical protein
MGALWPFMVNPEIKIFPPLGIKVSSLGIQGLSHRKRYPSPLFPITSKTIGILIALERRTHFLPTFNRRYCELSESAAKQASVRMERINGQKIIFLMDLNMSFINGIFSQLLKNGRFHDKPKLLRIAIWIADKYLPATSLGSCVIAAGKF